MSKFYCIHCGQHIDAGQHPAGSKLFCPSCGKEIVVPHTQKVSVQEPEPIFTEPTANLVTPDPPESPSLSETPTKSKSSLGGKIYSLFCKALSLLITGVIVLVVSRSCGSYIGKQAAEREREKRPAQTAPLTVDNLPPNFDFETILPEVVSTMNKSMPMTVDRDTRVDRVSSGPGNKITFHYSLTRMRISDFDRNDMITGLREQLIEGYKINPNFKFFKDNDVTFDYRYVDVDGAYFTTISVTSQDVR